MPLCLSLAAAVSNESPGTGQPLTPGIWGGPHVWMEVRQNGADLEFDCAHGSIDEPLILDASGEFDWKGTYVAERGGPATSAGVHKKARYHGRVDEDALQMVVSLAGSRADIGSFTLRKGVRGRLTKCVGFAHPVRAHSFLSFRASDLMGRTRSPWPVTVGGNAASVGKGIRTSTSAVSGREAGSRARRIRG
jgi:hypothetical protein